VPRAVAGTRGDDLQRRVARQIDLQFERAFQMREHDAPRLDGGVGPIARVRVGRRNLQRVEAAEAPQRIQVARIAHEARGLRGLRCEVPQRAGKRSFGNGGHEVMVSTDRHFQNARLAMPFEQAAQRVLECADMKQE
jgi:hypothetical protein